jgi:hypothetical protein
MAIAEAITYRKEYGILADFLNLLPEEVNMCWNTEWKLEDALVIEREEGIEEGREEEAARFLKLINNAASLDELKNALKLSANVDTESHTQEHVADEKPGTSRDDTSPITMSEVVTYCKEHGIYTDLFEKLTPEEISMIEDEWKRIDALRIASEERHGESRGEQAMRVLNLVKNGASLDELKNALKPSVNVDTESRTRERVADEKPGKSADDISKMAVEGAVTHCKGHGILSDFFGKLTPEEVTMLTNEWVENFKLSDAREDGRIVGREEEAARFLNLINNAASLDELKKYA